MKKQINIINHSLSFITGIFILILWEGSGRLNLLPKFVFPTPFQIITAFITDFSNLSHQSLITLSEAFLGLSIGICLAFILVIVMTMYSGLRRAFYPILVITQTIPTVAIAPILVMWLGYGMTPKVVLVILTTLFPIVVSILNGFDHSDQDAIRLLKLMGASKWQLLWHIQFPSSLPYFFGGLRISVTYAFIGAVVAEWLGGFEGLGVYMIQTRKAFAYDKMFAVIFLISMISLFFMWTVKFLEYYFVPWEYQDKKGGKKDEIK